MVQDYKPGIGKFCFVFFGGEGLHLQHMEIPRLEVKSELHLLAYSHSNARSKLHL